MLLRPRTVEEACSMLAAHDDATILAGGTDYMVEVNFRHRTPGTVIDLSAIDSLRTWHHDAGSATVDIGACVPMRDLEKGRLALLSPALAQAARTVGSPQIRAAATLGGNLGTSSPAGDTLPVLSALDATVVATSTRGDRRIPIGEFFLGPKRNVLSKDELIVAVSIPVLDGHHEYAKVGVRNAMVISIASVCVAFQQNSWRVALGSVGPTVLRCPEAEEYLTGHWRDSTIDPGVIDRFADMVASASRPIDDHRSSAIYRRHAVGVLAKRLTNRSLANVN